MQASKKAMDLIKQFEGFRSKAYLCPAGQLTIGYGHVIKLNKEAYLKDKTITHLEAEELLKQDVTYYSNHLNNICHTYQVTLAQNQFDALCSFCFNLGGFTKEMLNRFKQKNLTEVGKALTLYTKVDTQELEGLKKRRQAEQQLFLEE